MAPSYRELVNSYVPLLDECMQELRGEEWFVQKMPADGTRFLFTMKKESFSVFLYLFRVQIARKKWEGDSMQFFCAREFHAVE